MKDGCRLIAEERFRQCDVERYAPDHDDQHRAGELAMAAACYALVPYIRDMAPMGMIKTPLDRFWPWEREAWKPGDRVRELVKAGALIAAEIDRLQRMKK